MNHVTRNKILFIDSSDYELARIALVGQQVIWHKFQTRDLSEKLLPEIKSFFKKQKAGFDQITKIAVVTGPGGFSRIRSAVAVANALAFALKVPIAGINKTEVPKDMKNLKVLPMKKMVEPRYGKQPNITMSRSKF